MSQRAPPADAIDAIADCCRRADYAALAIALQQWPGTIDAITDSDRATLLTFAAQPQSFNSQSWPSDQSLQRWLELLKVISRLRTGLDPLYQPDTYHAIVSLGSSHSDSRVALEAGRLALNLTIIQSDTARARVSADLSILPTILAVIDTLANRSDDDSVERVFLLARILLFLIVSKPIASHCRSNNVYQIISQSFIRLAAPIATIGDQRRRALAELTKLLCHLAMEDSADNMVSAIDGDTAKSFAQSVTDILALTVTLASDIAAVIDGGIVIDTVPRPQTLLALAELAAIDTEQSNRPSALVSLRQLKGDISDCVIYLPRSIASVIATNRDAVQSLLLILHVRLIQAQSNRGEEVTLLCPILSSLTTMVEASQHFRVIAKTAIFLQHAHISADIPINTNASTTTTGSDGPSMVGAGAVSEKELDRDPQSLRALLVPHCTNIKFQVKHSTGEFLFQLCGQQPAELIRLVGFGNAVGVLAEKGLPGFGGMRQSAVDVDELCRQQR